MKMRFKLFLENKEQEDVKKLIKKLPKDHQKLIKGFKFHFESGNTLKSDPGHVGKVTDDKITIAAPFRFGRSMVLLHEIGHLVYKKLCNKEWKEKWSKVVGLNPRR